MDGGGGGGGGKGVIAPDAHTPTPTNYHCVIENKVEVKTEAPQTQMSQFVRFSPQRQKKKQGGRTVQVTRNILRLSLW